MTRGIRIQSDHQNTNIKGHAYVCLLACGSSFLLINDGPVVMIGEALPHDLNPPAIPHEPGNPDEFDSPVTQGI